MFREMMHNAKPLVVGVLLSFLVSLPVNLFVMPKIFTNSDALFAAAFIFGMLCGCIGVMWSMNREFKKGW